MDHRLTAAYADPDLKSKETTLLEEPNTKGLDTVLMLFALGFNDGIFQDMNTMEDLLSARLDLNTTRHPRIKPECLELPVMRRLAADECKSGRSELNRDEATKEAWLNDRWQALFKLLCARAGFVGTCSWSFYLGPRLTRLCHCIV